MCPPPLCIPGDACRPCNTSTLLIYACVCVFAYIYKLCVIDVHTHIFLAGEPHGFTFCCPQAFAFQDGGPRFGGPCLPRSPQRTHLFFCVCPKARARRPPRQAGGRVVLFICIPAVQGLPHETRVQASCFPGRRPLPGGDGQPQHLVSSVRLPLNRSSLRFSHAHPPHPQQGLNRPLLASSLAFPEGREGLGISDVTSPVLGSGCRTGPCCPEQLSGLRLGEVGVGGHGHGCFGTWCACAKASACETQLLGSRVPSRPWRQEEDRLWGDCWGM